MPADPTHNPTFRRASRKQEDDIEARRARGEVSCAECRRLKLKCDRQVPCSSCTRRGCPSLCPNSVLATGHSVRSALADSAQLQTKVNEMSERIRQLEAALASSQSSFSNEVHPLLKEELLSIKPKPENINIPAVPKQSVEQIIDALGTMSIGKRGEGKYFGRSAGTEMLVLAGAEIEHSQRAPTGKLPPELACAASTFPFSGGFEVPWDVLFKHLPPEPRAWSLCETYTEHSAWKFDPIRRDQLVDEVLSPIYKALKEHKSTGIYDTSRISAHHFAALYFVFAIGALLDLTLEPVNEEAIAYYNMGRGALACRLIFDSQEIICVQAVLLMAHYKTIGSRRFTMDSSWYLTSIAAKLAQGDYVSTFLQTSLLPDLMGLDRDSARFRMDSKTVQRRRHLFWELFSMDLFSSLWLGRPPTIRLADTDCELPDDDEATVDEHGNTLIGFSRWKFEFAKEIFAVVAERTSTAEAPRYQTILELDRKLREKVPPPHLNYFLDHRDSGFSPAKYLKRCLLGIYRSHISIYLHRSFCIQAMIDNPKNPLQSPFAPSYLATYQCASNFVKAAINHFETIPELCRRIWNIWTGTFSAAVIIGAIIIRSPGSPMAPRAFVELGLACNLFEKGVQKGVLQSEKGRAALGILNNLRMKALQACSKVRSDQPDASHHSETEKLDEGFDELALVGGQTKILVCQWLCSSKTEQVQLPTPPSQPSPGMDLPTPPSSGAEFSTTVDDMNQVHPALVNYISAFSPPDINSLAGNPQILMGAEPNLPFNYSGQPLPQDDLAWANYLALSTNEVDSYPSTISQVAQSSANGPVAAEAGMEPGQFYDEPWRALFHTPEIFQLDLSQPYFMTDGTNERY